MERGDIFELGDIFEAPLLSDDDFDQNFTLPPREPPQQLLEIREQLHRVLAKIDLIGRQLSSRN